MDWSHILAALGTGGVTGAITWTTAKLSTKDKKIDSLKLELIEMVAEGRKETEELRFQVQRLTNRVTQLTRVLRHHKIPIPDEEAA